jgi:hypothetical protein
VFLSRLPLPRRGVRLACLRHTASVHPEPGSNSQKEVYGTSSNQKVIAVLPPNRCSFEQEFDEIERRTSLVLYSTFSVFNVRTRQARITGKKKRETNVLVSLFFLQYPVGKPQDLNGMIFL